MEVAGIVMVILGYSLFYTGASNLFTGGQGWGFLQSLLNRGEANQSGSIANSGAALKSAGGALGSLGGFFGTLTNGNSG